MTENPNRENVVSYYDEHVKNKLNDYIVVNPRIELGWETIKRFTITKPNNALKYHAVQIP